MGTSTVFTGFYHVTRCQIRRDVDVPSLRLPATDLLAAVAVPGRLHPLRVDGRRGPGGPGPGPGDRRRDVLELLVSLALVGDLPEQHPARRLLLLVWNHTIKCTVNTGED